MNHKLLLIASALITGSTSLTLPLYGQQQPAAAAQETGEIKIQQLIQDTRELHRQRKFQDAVNASKEILEMPGLTVQEQYDALFLLGRSLLDLNKNALDAEAEQALRKATFLEGIDGKARYDAVLQLTRALSLLQTPRGTFATPSVNIYYDTWLDKQIADYSRVLELGDLTAAQQIHLYQQLANVQLDKLNVEEANRLLEKAIALPELTQGELAVARLNYARALVRQFETAKAIALYDQVLNSDGQNPAQQADTHVARSALEEDATAQLAYLRKHGIPAMRIANILRNQDKDIAITLYNDILQDTTASANDRWNSYRSLISLNAETNQLNAIKALFNQYADSFYEQNERYGYRAPFTDRNVINNAINRDPAFKLWVGETLLQKKLPDADRNVALNYVVTAASELPGQQNKVKPALDQLIASDTSLKPVDRLNLQVRLAIIQANNNPNNAAKGVLALLQKEEALDLNGQAEALLKAARYAMSLKQYPVARRLHEEREKMLVQEETPSLKVTFIPNGPKDISAFLQSDYFKNPVNHGVLNRRYSGDLKFLMETDTASAGRTMTTEDGKTITLATGDGAQTSALQQPQTASTRSEFTVFTASSDEDGVYFFFFMPVEAKRLQQIREGFASVGGFEITLAEGRDAPYSCLLIDPYPQQKISDGFLTQYSNRNYRVKQVDRNNMKADYQVVDGGVAMLLSFTWDAFVKLPQNGDKWYLEPIHWERGNWTWGGSNSVHWRETQGELVFDNLTPANRTTIKRRLLQRARAQYLRETSARDNGYIEFWMDNRLGDQQFYAEVVEPLKKKHDAYVARIKAEMTDQEVNEIYDNAYDFLINARFILSELRTQYLLRQLTATP